MKSLKNLAVTKKRFLFREFRIRFLSFVETCHFQDYSGSLHSKNLQPFLEFSSADFPDTWDECKETEELNCKAGLWETCCPADDWCISENGNGDPIR